MRPHPSPLDNENAKNQTLYVFFKIAPKELRALDITEMPSNFQNFGWNGTNGYLFGTHTTEERQKSKFGRFSLKLAEI